MKKKSSRSEVAVLAVFLVIAMAFSMVISVYNYRGNRKDIQTQTATVLANETVVSIENSLKFGKDLENYYGMEEILQNMLDYLGGESRTAVLSGDGEIMYQAGGEIQDADGCIKVPIQYEEQQGELLVELPDQGQTREFQEVFANVGKITAALALVCILLLAASYHFIKEKLKKPVFLGIAFLGILLQGGLSIGIFQNGYQEAMYEEADLILLDIHDNISSVMEQGVSLDETADLDEYLAGKIENVPILWNLRVVESYADTTELTGNENALVRSYELGDGEVFIQAELSSQYISEKLSELVWIIVSTLLISVIFIFELFRLPFVLRYRLGPNGLRPCPETYENISGSLRIISFLCSTAEYLCVPYAAMLIRQTESTAFGLSVGMTAAFPIMIEGITQTAAMLLLPVATKKASGRRSLSVWILLMLFSNVAAFFGTTAWHWIACRAVAGFAYGGFKEVTNLIITCGYDTPQRRSQNLAADNAGLLAGTTCGAGLGAIIASAVGFDGTYLVSAVLFAVYGAAALWMVPWKLLGEKKASVQEGEKERFRLQDLKNILLSKGLWSYLIFAIIPLNIGVILIVSLIPALCQKWEISMIILSYCYIVNGVGGIYFGPWILKKCSRFLKIKSYIGIILIVLAVSLAILKLPIAATLLASSFLLGFFDGFGTPAISDGFMELPAIKRNMKEHSALMLFMILCCVFNSIAPVAAELMEGFF